jgi:hypothetical protein
MKSRVFALLLAAFAQSAIANTHQASRTVRDGSTPERAIVLQYSSRRYVWDTAFDSIRQRYPDLKPGPDEKDLRTSDGGRTYTVAIYFATASHGRRKMYFKTTWYAITH